MSKATKTKNNSLLIRSQCTFAKWMSCIISLSDQWKENKEFNQDYVLYPVELSCAYTEPGSAILKNDGVKVRVSVCLKFY